MAEAWIMELLQSVREIASTQKLHRLAEHIDDAMLVAASEFHEAQDGALGMAEHEREGSAAAGEFGGHHLH